MNWDQIISVAEKLVTTLGTLAVTLGLLNASQEGPVVESIVTILGALGVLLPALNGIWRHTDTNTAKSAAQAITALATTSDPATKQAVVAPVVQALRAQGATVNTTGIVGVNA